MPPIADDVRVSRPSDTVASSVDDQVVILQISSGHFFHLNDGGSRIWDLLDRPMTVGDVCAALSDRYEVEPETCRRDVAEFVELMSAKGLLELG
ncbi:MAG: PqqD family protein [Pseudomonadota bacterium]